MVEDKKRKAAATDSKSGASEPTKQENFERLEGHISGHQGTELFYQKWSVKNPRGTLVFTHGFAEHSECYAKTAADLANEGWNVCAWDLRGHGRSEGKRGYVDDFHSYALDLCEVLKYLGQKGWLSKNFALVGHSLGGLVTLRYLIDQSENPVGPQPRAAVLSSPLIGLSMAVPPIKDFASRLLNRFAPKMTLFNELRYEDLIRDAEALKSYEHDPLRHDKISPGVYLGILANAELVKQRAGAVTLPILVQAAGKERIVSLPETQALFPLIGSKDKRLMVYDESYHEIYNDLDRKDVIKDLTTYLNEKLA